MIGFVLNDPGRKVMRGQLLTLAVTINGTLMAGPNNTVLRVPGTTTVVGTATNSDGGVYDVNVTL